LAFDTLKFSYPNPNCIWRVGWLSCRLLATFTGAQCDKLLCMYEYEYAGMSRVRFHIYVHAVLHTQARFSSV